MARCLLSFLVYLDLRHHHRPSSLHLQGLLHHQLVHQQVLSSGCVLGLENVILLDVVPYEMRCLEVIPRHYKFPRIDFPRS